MGRLVVTLALLVAAIAPLGCAADGEWSVRRLFGVEDPAHPSMDKYPKPDMAVALRVEDLGKKIVTLNHFIGIDPLFHTVGVPEAVLFHRGPEELFISEGLVKRCKTDAELAAVICSELGQMVAEKRAVKRAARDRDDIPDVALGVGSPTFGGPSFDVGRQAEMAYEQQRPKAPPVADPVDAAKQARTILSTAGFDPAALDQVQPLLKQSDRGINIRKQMSGSAPAPTWTPQSQ